MKRYRLKEIFIVGWKVGDPIRAVYQAQQKKWWGWKNLTFSPSPNKEEAYKEIRDRKFRIKEAQEIKQLKPRIYEA